MVRKKFGGLPTAPGLPARFFAGVYDKIGRVMLIPFGRPFLALMFCSLAGGGVMLLRSPWQRADLSVWVSVESHARIYQQIGGTRATVDLIAPAALEVRLLSLFMFDKPTNSSPDLVEVDLGSAGKVFRPPLEEIGFLPLNDYLARSGWMSKILSSRFFTLEQRRHHFWRAQRSASVHTDIPGKIYSIRPG